MKKVYIASPFFNNNQLTRVQLVETILEKLEIDYFSPRKEAVCDINAGKEERQRVFKGNVDAIDECDLVIAITDDKDMGTIFEAGYAYAREIPIIYAAFNLPKDAQFNLMLAESAVSVVTSASQLESVLKDEELFNWEGAIE